ncbi:MULTISPECIES: hypothetical protein [unclassified Methylophaga]|jgi:hypothetical protein|uniref:hypothetical protein n=1 Tax=unclassified Methylophaga TaxID=2629249 RepID=UPI0025E864D9|nr:MULTISPECIES: hypothetical protein [unclassified Methylophaga]|tara:strand:+ start:532 stop:798 length:267 start_codon:yes stop_codon:yes gene_type:complete
MNTNADTSIKWRVTLTAVVTLLYWYWESKTSGNIRIDLFLIYPVLTAIYMIALWSKFRIYAVFISLVLMIINFIFFMISYDLFNKNPG